ncbi:C6.1a, putative [Ricinus communis]|uniref:C6.1a, putative n=1 Tax=Ricinus communis TaxID=3988 RepID=B9RV18_RICCO|nr:C6.1a, putative [Ricinus communis]
MSEDVWLTCLAHALSTETEEIMGLLLGDIEYSKNGSVTALIWGASPQSRSDRRKDRVETNPEQLAAASAQAEISLILHYNDSINRTNNKGDWVVPLASSYYSFSFSRGCADSGNVSTSRSWVGRIQVIAFQSSDGKQNNTIRPISVSPVNRGYIDVESSLSSSEYTSVKSGSGRIESAELDTGDSRTAAGSNLGDFFANADANYVGRERIGGNYKTGNSDGAFFDIDPMDMSESMQEAMHRSNLDMSGAEYIRKEIPLHVLPTWALLKLDSPLTSFTDLQRVLYEEERGAYIQAMLQNMRDGKIHPLTFIHHTSTYQASMCKLIEYCLSPAINTLQDRLRENEIRLAMLTDEAKVLESETFRGSESASRSPHLVSSHGLRGSASSGARDMHNSSESLSVRAVASPGSRTRSGS